MRKIEKNARRAVRQANGLSPGFRYFDNPFDGQTVECPLCKKAVAAGLEICPECGEAIPGQQRSREQATKSPLVILMAACLLALLGLGVYFFIQEMIESGFIDLLLNG